MANNRVAGVAYFKVDGKQFSAKGSFTHNITPTTREGVSGQDGTHGYKEMPKVPYIEGTITTVEGFDMEALHEIDDATVTLECANNTAVMLRNAWYAGDGEVNTEEGETGVRFEGLSGEQL